MTVYSRILEQILLPAHNLVRGRNYVHHLRFLEKSQWWSREKLLEFQWKETRSLLEHALHSVPYYAKKYAEAGIRLEDIKSPEDFRRLPVLAREEVNAHRQELCSTAYRGKLMPHATGGSTGVPTRFYKTIESYDWRTAAMARAYSWSGCRPGERTVLLWGAPVGKEPLFARAKKRAHDFLQRQLIFQTFSQTPDRWLEIYEQVVGFKPRLLVGYVSSLEEFAGFVRERNLALPGIEAAIAAAEPLFDDTRARIERAIGAPVFNTYGSREFMSIAGECDRHQGLHIHCENLLLEAAGDKAEEPSDFLVTDLHNYGMPFIRYAIGDLGVLDDSPCPCGRGLPRIKSIEGRPLDMLGTADGRAISAIVWRHILKDAPEVREYQVEQKRLDLIVVSLVLDAPLSEKSRLLMTNEFKKYLGQETGIEFRPVENIRRLASGKRRAVIGIGAGSGS